MPGILVTRDRRWEERTTSKGPKKSVQHTWLHPQEMIGNLQLPALYTCPRSHSPEFYTIQERVIKRKQKKWKKEKKEK